MHAWQAIHRWSSLACTAIVLLLCLTGLPLVFADDIEEALAARVPRDALGQNEAITGIDSMVRTARARHPAEIVRFVFVDNEEALVKVVMAPADSPRRDLDHRVEFDARSGALVGERVSQAAQAPSFMQLTRRLHAELLAGSVGEYVLAGTGLLFVLAAVSGLVLYLPYPARIGFGTVRQGPSRRRWLDLHNLLGVCTLVWALTVGATGVLNALSKPLSAHWRSTQTKALLAGPADLPVIAHPASAQAAYDAVREALPGRNVTSLIFPSRAFANPRHFLVWTNGNTPLTHRLFTAALVDARTSRLDAIAQMPVYLRLLQVSRPLHFGDYGGLPLKLIWAALDTMTIIVLVSGLHLWVRRRLKRAQ